MQNIHLGGISPLLALLEVRAWLVRKHVMYFWYVAIKHTIIFKQGWRQEFSDGGLTLLTRELKYGFQGTIDAKNLRKYRFSPSDGGLACSDGGLACSDGGLACSDGGLACSDGGYCPYPPLVPPLFSRQILEKNIRQYVYELCKLMELIANKRDLE